MFSTQTIQSSFANFLRVFVRTSATAQPQVATPTRSKRRHRLTISLRQAATPSATAIMTICGKVDSRSYQALVEKSAHLRAGGIEQLVVDLNEMPTLELTGLYALHCIAKIFRDERHADPKHGLSGLRRIAEENLEAGMHPRVKLLVADKAMAEKLTQAGLDQLFPIHRTETGALRSS